MPNTHGINASNYPPVSPKFSEPSPPIDSKKSPSPITVTPSIDSTSDLTSSVTRPSLEGITAQPSKSTPQATTRDLFDHIHDVMFKEGVVSREGRTVSIANSGTAQDAQPKSDPSAEIIQALEPHEFSSPSSTHKTITAQKPDPLLHIHSDIQPNIPEQKSLSSKVISLFKKVTLMTFTYNLLLSGITKIACWKLGVRGLAGQDIDNLLVSMSTAYRTKKPQNFHLKSIKLGANTTLSNMKLMCHTIDIPENANHLQAKISLSAEISYPNPKNPQQIIKGTLLIEPTLLNIDFKSIKLIKSLLSSANIALTFAKIVGSAMGSIGSKVSSKVSQLASWFTWSTPKEDESEPEKEQAKTIPLLTQLLIPTLLQSDNIKATLSIDSTDQSATAAERSKQSTLHLKASDLSYDTQADDESKLHISETKIEASLNNIKDFFPLEEYESFLPVLHTGKTEATIKLKDLNYSSKTNTRVDQIFRTNSALESAPLSKLQVDTIDLDLSGDISCKKGHIQGLQQLSHDNGERNITATKIQSFNLPQLEIQAGSLASDQSITCHLEGSQLQRTKVNEYALVDELSASEYHLQERNMPTISSGSIAECKIKNLQFHDNTQTNTNMPPSPDITINAEDIKFMTNSEQQSQHVTAQQIQNTSTIYVNQQDKNQPVHINAEGKNFELNRNAESGETKTTLAEVELSVDSELLQAKSISIPTLSCNLDQSGITIEADKLSAPEITTDSITVKDTLCDVVSIHSQTINEARVTTLKTQKLSSQLETKNNNNQTNQTSTIELDTPELTLKQDNKALTSNIKCKQADLNTTLYDAESLLAAFETFTPDTLNTLKSMLTNNEIFAKFIIKLAVKRRIDTIMQLGSAITPEKAHEQATADIDKIILDKGIHCLLEEFGFSDDDAQEIVKKASHFKVRWHQPAAQILQKEDGLFVDAALESTEFDAKSIYNTLDIAGTIGRTTLSHEPNKQSCHVKSLEINQAHIDLSTNGQKSLNLTPNESSSTIGSLQDLAFTRSTHDKKSNMILNVPQMAVNSNAALQLGSSTINMELEAQSSKLKIEHVQTPDSGQALIAQAQSIQITDTVLLNNSKTAATLEITEPVIGLSQGSTHGTQAVSSKFYSSADQLMANYAEKGDQERDDNYIKLTLGRPSLNVVREADIIDIAHDFDQDSSKIQGNLLVSHSISESADLNVNFTSDKTPNALSGVADIHLTGNAGEVFNLLAQKLNKKSRFLSLLGKIGKILDFDIKIIQLPIKNGSVLVADVIKNISINVQFSEGNLFWILKPALSFFNISLQLAEKFMNAVKIKKEYSIQALLKTYSVNSTALPALEMPEMNSNLEKIYLHLKLNRELPKHWNSDLFEKLLREELATLYSTSANPSSVTDQLKAWGKLETPTTPEDFSALFEKLAVLKQSLGLL